MTEAPTIPRLPGIGTPAPLSFAQEGVWLADQLRPGEATFTLPMAFRLRGPLSSVALSGALHDVVARHSMLRTVIHGPEGRPVQLVRAAAPHVPGVTDLSGLPELERYPAALSAARRNAGRPLDPRSSVLRTHIYRLGPRDNLLFLAVHHIAWDGWSVGVFCRDLAEFYRRRTQGARADLPGLPVSYVDYAAWQRGRWDGAALSGDLDFWRGELAGKVSPLELPSAYPPNPSQRSAGLVRHRVAPEQMARVQTIARLERVSLFMLLKTALHAVLHRLTGARSVATTYAAAHRDHSDLQNLVGLFVNQLVLRTDCGHDPSFIDLVRQVRTTVLRSIRHADLPYEHLVRELDLDPEALGQVRLGFQNATDVSLFDLPGITVDLVELHNGSARKNLDLVATERDGGLDFVAIYDAGQIDELSVAQLLGRVEQVLVAGCGEPEQTLSRLPLLVDGEAVTLSRVGSGPPPRAPEDTVRSVIRAQIERTPDADALVHGDQTVTYRELGERADVLSHVLHDHGVRAGETVAVHLERSVDFAVTTLAVFDLGAHYLPLDPALPDDRIEFMIADTAPVLVVTSARRPASFPVSTAVLDLDLSRGAVPNGSAPEMLQRAGPKPGHRAYVMYTSGSTGRPKGTTVPHQGVVNILRHHQELVPLGTGDRVLHSASLAFDLSVIQLYWPLSTGATVVIAPDEITPDVKALAELAAAERVTVMAMVPSVLSTYLAADPAPLPHLRVVFAAGEALSTELIRRIRRYAAVPVINCYGPTEATIIAVMWVIGPDEDLPTSVPIGHPVSGVRCHVLDRLLRPVPLGTVGELYLGGVGVSTSSGYLGRPDLTAEQYVPDVSGRPGDRMYRTGDLVRMYDDGTMHYLGRVDRQVKLGGVRMEPEEIQAVLERHDNVSEAYVTVHNGQLVAYVIGTADASKLRAATAAKLPRHMVPSRFLHLDRMPLTPNGKLDVAALPDPATAPVTGSAFVPPQTRTERVVAERMAAILGLERVGSDDDFFALGGSSLEAAQLMHELGAELGGEARLRDLFSAPVVARLAARLDGGANDTATSPLVPLAEGTAGSLHLVHPAAGSVFCYTRLAASLAGAVGVTAFQAVGVEEDLPPLESVDAMAEHYAKTLRDAHEGPYLLGGWCIGGLIALEVARKLTSVGEHVQRLVLLDTHLPATHPSDFTDAELAFGFVEELAATGGVRAPLSAAEVAALSVDGLARALRSTGLLPPGTDDAAVRRRVAVYRANVRGVTAYLSAPLTAPQPTPYPVTIVRAASSPPLLPIWATRLDGVSDERTVPGDHYSMLGETALADLIREIAS